MLQQAIPRLEQLSTVEKLALLAELWDDLAGHEAELPVTPGQQRLLDERYAEHRANPSAGTTGWPEAKARILSRLC
jgi:putative addiction module component (TIGR02574 family)